MSKEKITQTEECLMDMQKYIKDKINLTTLDSNAVRILKSIRKKVKKELFKIREKQITNSFVIFNFEYVNEDTFKVTAVYSVSDEVIDIFIANYSTCDKVDEFVKDILTATFKKELGLKINDELNAIRELVVELKDKKIISCKRMVYKDEI